MQKKSWLALIHSVILLTILVSACSQPISSATPNLRNITSTHPIIFPTSTRIPSTQLSTRTIITTTPTNSPIADPSNTPTHIFTSPSPTTVLTPTPDVRQIAYYWRNWPVIPTLSARAIQVFYHGQELGNNLHSFTRIGDCQSVPDVFLGIYDTDRYFLPTDDEYLQSTINYFSGSFSQSNVTVKDGFGVASVLAPLMANPQLCLPEESPLDCEYRLHKPIIAFISMGTNWQPNSSATFERYLRQIVDFCIEHGIIPVLMTKADNIEQDYLLNQAIAQVAYDYDMPLFNTWSAVQYLPNHGLEENRIYLTPEAWDVRNFTALQALDSIWTTLSSLFP